MSLELLDQNCLACEKVPIVSGALCQGCLRKLNACERPRVARSHVRRPAGAGLVDGSGRLYLLGDVTPVRGLDSGVGIFVLHSTISRNHAEFAEMDDGWRVFDLGSRFGCTVGGTAVGSAGRRVEPGSVVQIGTVGFVFVKVPMPCDEAESWSLRPVELPPRTARGSMGAPSLCTTSWGEYRVSTGNTSGGYGICEFRGEARQLSPACVELLKILIEAAQGEFGFVPSSALIGSLSWDVPFPTGNHLKQRIRRLRAALRGWPMRIEGRRGFGYRLVDLPNCGSDIG